MKKLFFIFILSINCGFSQDPVFTQFYNIPESMNPAFAGGGGGSEIGVLNRTQWPGLDYSLIVSFFILIIILKATIVVLTDHSKSSRNSYKV